MLQTGGRGVVKISSVLDFQKKGRRSLVTSQIVLFASTLGILKFSKEGEALFVNLPDVS